MTDLSVDLEWWRDSKGYRLKDPEKPKPAKRTPQKKPRMVGLLGSSLDAENDQAALVGQDAIDLTLLGSIKKQWEGFAAFERQLGQEQTIVPLGGDRILYRPLSEFGDVLYLEFARSARDAAGALRFVQRFGPLTMGGLDPKLGESVTLVAAMAEAMYGWLIASGEGGAKAMVGPQGLQLGNLMATLVVDQITGKPKVRFRADSLITGLWIQLGHALSEGATFRECRYCGTLFETGPGSGRRFDAQFCSDQHRVTFNSHKRSKAAANA